METFKKIAKVVAIIVAIAAAIAGIYFAVTKLIRDLKEEDKPGWLFIENVKNLLSVNRGFDFAKLLVELDEVGYDAEWSVLNSKYFGVPQNRERIFLFSILLIKFKYFLLNISLARKARRASTISFESPGLSECFLLTGRRFTYPCFAISKE